MQLPFIFEHTLRSTYYQNRHLVSEIFTLKDPTASYDDLLKRDHQDKLDESLKAVSFVCDVTIFFRQKPIELPLIELIEKET